MPVLGLCLGFIFMQSVCPLARFSPIKYLHHCSVAREAPSPALHVSRRNRSLLLEN